MPRELTLPQFVVLQIVLEEPGVYGHFVLPKARHFGNFLRYFFPLFHQFSDLSVSERVDVLQQTVFLRILLLDVITTTGPQVIFKEMELVLVLAIGRRHLIRDSIESLVNAEITEMKAVHESALVGEPVETKIALGFTPLIIALFYH